MSTGKRLAKRSILGTRVACCLDDGKYYPAVIVDVRSRSPEDVRPSLYTVRVEGEKRRRELCESALVGGGFCPMSAIKLRQGQKVYVTHNNREICATVAAHNRDKDEVIVSIPGNEGPDVDIKKRLDEVRLLESRKSARLADQDTDFAKLADVSTDRKRPPGGPSSGRSSPVAGPLTAPSTVVASSFIDVPGSTPIPMQGSRKRRSSRGFGDEDTMDECAAALVLMKLSCSPRSNFMQDGVVSPDGAPSSSYTSSGVWSWSGGRPSPATVRSGTPSPPLSSPPSTDDDIHMDDDALFDDAPRKRRSSTRTMFRCTWSDCGELKDSSKAIEKHIRVQHLGKSAVHRSKSTTSLHSSSSDSDSDDEHDEYFYWTEVEVNVTTSVDSSDTQQYLVPPRSIIVADGAVVTAPAVGQQQLISSPSSTAAIVKQEPTSPKAPVAGVIAAPAVAAAPTSVITLNSSPPVSPTAKYYHHHAAQRPATVITSPHRHIPILSSNKPMFGGSHIRSVSQYGTQMPIQISPATTSQFVKVSPQPTLSHMDMARPPHEDPEYRRQHGLTSGSVVSVLSSSWPRTSPYLTSGSGIGGGKVRVTTPPKPSPGRSGGKRSGESRKCRKVYGMEHKDQWCTQCKWKKACTRFGE